MATRFDIHLTVNELALSRGEQTLIQGLHLTLAPGQALWLTGPNGIGKTTLLLGLAGLITPDQGEIIWQAPSARLTPPLALAYAAHRGPERTGLTLGEELRFWQDLASDADTMEQRLAAVGLDERHNTPVAGLSAGQRRRLALARLMLSDRAAWLMDEPLSGLDTDGRALVTQTLSTHLARGGMALIASHQPVPIDGVKAQKLVLEPGEQAAA